MHPLLRLSCELPTAPESPVCSSPQPAPARPKGSFSRHSCLCGDLLLLLNLTQLRPHGMNSFARCDVGEIFPSCCLWQQHIYFHCCMSFCCINTSQCIYTFYCWLISQLFLILPFVKKVAKSLLIHIFFWCGFMQSSVFWDINLGA